MKRIKVRSSNIISVGYDIKEKYLDIEFSSDSVYRYHNVDKEVWEKLTTSKSIGKFVWGNIRGMYRYEKI